ncbi:MAG TPA: fumarylacetoacetate hydrolase family protein, partial [Ramlibacter sp.]|nr:fumarylacetoacetate hydrolase family protein [Ramlibacter sp.]
MKLISYKHAGRETWGAVSGDHVLDLAAATGCTTLAEFIASPSYRERDAVASSAKAGPRLADVELLPVIPRPEKIICAVRNYMDHHQEALAAGLQRELSDFPPIFLRVWRSQVAHGQPVVRPRVSETLDWEGELAVIIGEGGRDIAEADAWKHIAGYSCYNDVSV